MTFNENITIHIRTYDINNILQRKLLCLSCLYHIPKPALIRICEESARNIPPPFPTHASPSPGISNPNHLGTLGLQHLPLQLSETTTPMGSTCPHHSLGTGPSQSTDECGAVILLLFSAWKQYYSG